jgi:hypothetical protein
MLFLHRRFVKVLVNAETVQVDFHFPIRAYRELIASRPLNLPRFPFNSARRNDLQLSFILSREPDYALRGLLCIAVISNGNQ